jgi:hypothetical protein
MRRIIAILSVMAIMVAASAVPVFAQGAEVIPCSEFFGDPAVKGVIVVTPSGHLHFNCKFPDTP